MCQNPCWKLVVSPLAALEPCGFTPWFQVSGRLEPAKVVEREENKYDQQVRNCRVLATGTVEQKKTATIFAVICFSLPAFYVEKNYEVWRKGCYWCNHLRPSLILGAFDPWNPTATPLGNPQALPVSRQLGATETEEFHQGFFCLTMEGECPEQSTDLAGLWGREGYARFEAQWWNRERKKSQWKVLLPWVFLGLPPLRTNISHPKAPLKMTFLFPRWDMLVPWRVFFLRGNEPDLFGPILPPGISWKLFMQFEALVR